MQTHARLLSPLLISVIAIAGGCATDGAGATERGQLISLQPVAEAEAMRNYSGLTTRQRLVVRDAQTWRTVWFQIASNRQPAPPIPEVDFTFSDVVVAAMGTQPSGGHAIYVDSVYLNARGNDRDATIAVVEQSPGARCAVTDALTAPVFVAVVAKLPDRISFTEDATQLDCQ